MTIRYWLSGPRIFRGLIRPGISFSAADLAGAFAKRPKAAQLSMIFIMTRGDGAVMIGSGKTAAERDLEMSGDDEMALVFMFNAPSAADAVLAGTVRRLAKERVDAKGWYVSASAGMVAAAVKAEASALSYEFGVVHPERGEAPSPASTGMELQFWVGFASLMLIAGLVAHLLGLF